MKKKKILKYLLVAILTALVIGSIYCLIKYFKTGNQYINIANSEKYFLGSDLEATVEITSEKFLEKRKNKC